MSSGILLLFESRVDRLLLGLGFFLSLLAGVLLFTQTQDAELLGKSPVIGVIKTISSVNRRHARALSWSKIDKESKLYLKDMIYTPPKSSAEVILNSNEKLTLEPDSMVEFDSVSSDRFNIVLIQGAAKLVSDKGTSTAILQKPEAVEVKMPEVQKPQLPVFFIDTKSWEASQKELIQNVYTTVKSAKLLPEDQVKLAQLELNALSDYKLGLLAPKISNAQDPEGPWYRLSWTVLPVKGTVYEIEVSRNADFKPAIKHETLRTFLDIQFLEEGNHYWRVVAKNKTEKSQSSSESLNVPPMRRGITGKEGE
ncbi:MAG: hypothetical protein EBQ92_03245 [Proteobacteria bacterium]|nr:hypothetical protein [Pseudomonadota bacterium]